MSDQAERLRQIADSFKQEILAPIVPVPKKRARVVAVTSGKGGVGKTNFSVNLGYCLLKMEHEVLIFDADLGLANVDVLLGTAPSYHLGHVLAGEKEILDLIYSAPGGLKLIAGGSGIGELADLSETELYRFIQNMRKLESQTDYLLVDTGAGVGRSVTSFVLAADVVIVVTNPEPTSITDAYAVIKTISRYNRAADVKLVVNQAASIAEADQAASRLSTTVLRFLNVSIDYLGAIPYDPQVSRSVKNQEPFYMAAPYCSASLAVEEIARRLTGNTKGAVGKIGLFFDRLGRMFSRIR
jgi:flagellar biosynthesis protein FlhG